MRSTLNLARKASSLVTVALLVLYPAALLGELYMESFVVSVYSDGSVSLTARAKLALTGDSGSILRGLVYAEFNGFIDVSDKVVMEGPLEAEQLIPVAMVAAIAVTAVIALVTVVVYLVLRARKKA
ncbi:MAG: hypothetical protein QW496_05725 [Desulfurococcaceae archaeon]